jgi:uncharacterized protein YgfB (UPF0149 family)
MDYCRFEETLAGVADECSAAQWHGLLCGLLCAGGPIDTQAWIDCAAAFSGKSPVLPAETGVVLETVFERTLRQFGESRDGMEFDLFLPDEESSLGSRAEALKLWCEGFLYGLSAGGLTGTVRLLPDSNEFLRDLAEFCKLGDIEDATTDGDEFYLQELIEYTRAGVLLLYDELNHDTSSNQTLH